MTLAQGPNHWPSESIPGLARKVDIHWRWMEAKFKKHSTRCPKCWFWYLVSLGRRIKRVPRWYCLKSEPISNRAEQIAALCDKLNGICPECGAEKGECQAECPNEPTCYDCGKPVSKCRNSKHQESY